MIGSLIRDIGLGIFVNGLFTITQNGLSFNAAITTFIAIKILYFGILIQKKEKEDWKMDGQTIITIFATITLIFSMWYVYKLNNKHSHH